MRLRCVELHRVLKKIGSVKTKKPGKLRSLSIVICILFAGFLAPVSGAPVSSPQGNTGIASKYPGDLNIQNHPDVIFTDNFESYTTASQLTSRWDGFYHPAYTKITMEAGKVYSGLKALEFTLPQSTAEISNAVVKNIAPTRDVLFVRVYTKFDSTYNIPGSNHNGITISAKYPGPGIAPNGRNFFLFHLQNTMQGNAPTPPGYSDLYVYHPEQRSNWGDLWFPTGMILPNSPTPSSFGSYFVSRPNFIPLRNKWYCYELMVKANTAGQRDGRAAFWIDGKLIADFQNLRMRDINTLKIDRVQLLLHAKTCAHLTRKWYDNLVVAKSYIGPLQ
jgi:hypothetical protein